MISHPVKQTALRARPEDPPKEAAEPRQFGEGKLLPTQMAVGKEYLTTEAPAAQLAPWQADPNPVLVFGALGRELGVLATDYHHLPRAFASYKETLRSMLVSAQRTDQLVRTLLKAAEAAEEAS